MLQRVAAAERECADKLRASRNSRGFTSAYPEFWKGGVQQLHADGKIFKCDKTDILPLQKLTTQRADYPTEQALADLEIILVRILKLRRIFINLQPILSVTKR
jgi:hypothetical protein